MDINNGICEFVLNYNIDGSDYVIPKILGSLEAIGTLIKRLVPTVKESHLTRGVVDELFCAAMFIENEAKETLKNFMIKSNKGKAGQEDRVLSLQKLYRMNAEGDGFLAKVKFEESQTYTELPHKRKQVWNDTNMNRLEGKIDMKMKDIGCDLVTNGDYSNINYQYTVTPTYIDYQKKTLLQWLDDTQYKIDEATEKKTLNLTALKEAKKAFDRNYVREHGERF